MLIWEDGIYKELTGASGIEGERFASCKEAFTLR